jgi:hypothetical protein
MFMAIGGPPMSKPQTRASYEARLNRVVDYIYAHLDEDLGFDDLADPIEISPPELLTDIHLPLRGFE